MTKLTIVVVLDRSGSMQSIKEDTIGAFNEYVSTVAKDSPESTLSLIIFDSQSIDTIYSDIAVTHVKPLDGTTFVPRASTPLYDAMGQAAHLLDTLKGDNKVFVTITDGEENSSREYRRETIKSLLAERQEKNKWLVMYLGANQDAFAVGKGIGAQVANTMNFTATSVGMRNAVGAAAAATSRYAMTGKLQSAEYTAAERSRAMGIEPDLDPVEKDAE